GHPTGDGRPSPRASESSVDLQGDRPAAGLLEVERSPLGGPKGRQSVGGGGSFGPLPGQRQGTSPPCIADTNFGIEPLNVCSWPIPLLRIRKLNQNSCSVLDSAGAYVLQRWYRAYSLSDQGERGEQCL